ncbi:MAG: SPOR domain-containing protein, partial [Gammaproteobacteria bacterium]|nr:SPOR domain-containing protein [Gammaproteobacteria bacterium]
MKEKIVGLLTLILLVGVTLSFLLQGQGLESIQQFISKKKSVAIEQSEDVEPNELIWIIQIAAFENYQEAEILSKELERKSFNVFINQKDILSKTIYRVRVKPKSIDDPIEKTVRRLERNDYTYQILPPGQQ